MTTDSRTMPAFGKRLSNEVWARAQHEKRELAISPWRFSICLASLVALAFLLLLEAVEVLGGGEGLGPIGQAAAWVSGAPGVLAGLMVLVPTALLAQCAWSLLGIGLSGQPLVVADSAGITVYSRTGGIIMAWEEVARIAFAPGLVRFDRKPRAVPRMCSGPAYDRQHARAPLLLVSGGAEALREALAELRPDIARRHFT